jgi:type IV pilus assembly protein PilY1
VGFIGGGWNGGKGFFAFRMSDGEILWRKTSASGMVHDFVATPLLVDTDQDGFIDRVYAADLGGNIWRFKLCEKDKACSRDSWDGQRFFQGSGEEKIFTSLTSARDNLGRLWIYWGTGDKADPSALPHSPDKIYAAQDDGMAILTSSSLGTIDQFNAAPKSYKGWYHAFKARGEKMISDPAMLKGVLYFTTYIPPDSTGADVCYKAGYSNLYAMQFATGKGALDHGASCRNVGTGMASSVMVSMTKTGVDAFISRTHGKGRPEDRIPLRSSDAVITNILYWRDKRLQ